MNSKRYLQIAGGAAALAILLAAIPRAAHAVAAALVQVTNTAANPAITQDVARQAAQSISLNASGSNPTFAQLGFSPSFVASTHPLFYLPTPDTVAPTRFSGPGSANLMITAIEIYNPGSSAGTAALFGMGVNPPATEQIYESWNVAANGTAQYTFPTGFVVAAGTQNLAALMSSPQLTVTIHGYLTTN